MREEIKKKNNIPAAWKKERACTITAYLSLFNVFFLAQQILADSLQLFSNIDNSCFIEVLNLVLM